MDKLDRRILDLLQKDGTPDGAGNRRARGAVEGALLAAHQEAFRKTGVIRQTVALLDAQVAQRRDDGVRDDEDREPQCRVVRAVSEGGARDPGDHRDLPHERRMSIT